MDEELKKKRQFKNGILKIIFGILGGFVLVCGIVVGIMYLTGAFNPVVTPPESIYFEYENYESDGEEDLYVTIMATPDNVTEKEVLVSVDNNTIFSLKGMTTGNEGNSITAEIGEQILIVPKKNHEGVVIGGTTQIVAKTPDQKYTAKTSVFIDVPVQNISLNTTGATLVYKTDADGDFILDESGNKILLKKQLYVGGSLDFSSLTYYPSHSQNPLNDLNKKDYKSYILTLSSLRLQGTEEVWDTVGAYWKYDGKGNWVFNNENSVTGSFVANWDTSVSYPKVNTLKVGSFKLTAYAFKSYKEEANIGAGQIFDYMSITSEDEYEVTHVGISRIEMQNYSNARLALRYIKASENTKQKVFANFSYSNLEKDCFNLGLKITAIAGFEHVDLSEQIKNTYLYSSNPEVIKISGSKVYETTDGQIAYYPYTDGVDYYWIIDTLKTTSNTTIYAGVYDSNSGTEKKCAVSTYAQEIETDVFRWTEDKLEMFMEGDVTPTINLQEKIKELIINQNNDGAKIPSHNYIKFYAAETEDESLSSRIDVDKNDKLILDSGVEGYLIKGIDPTDNQQKEGLLVGRGYGDVTVYAVLSKTNYNGEVETIGGSVIYRKAVITLEINTVISKADLVIVPYKESDMDFEDSVTNLDENKQYAVVIYPKTSSGYAEDVEVLKQAIVNNKITIKIASTEGKEVYVHPYDSFEFDQANELYYVRLSIDDLSKVETNNKPFKYKIDIYYFITEGNEKKITGEETEDEFTLTKTSITSLDLFINDKKGASKQSDIDALKALIFKASIDDYGITYNFQGVEGSSDTSGAYGKPIEEDVKVYPSNDTNDNAYILESSDSTVIKVVDGKFIIQNISEGYVYLTAYASTNREIYSTVKVKVIADDVSFEIKNDKGDDLTPDGYEISKEDGSIGAEVYYHKVYIGDEIDIAEKVKVKYHNNGDVVGNYVPTTLDFVTYSFTRSGESIFEEFDSSKPSVVRITHNPNVSVPITVNVKTKFGATAKYHLEICPALEITNKIIYKDAGSDDIAPLLVAKYNGELYQAVYFEDVTGYSKVYNIGLGNTFKYKNSGGAAAYFKGEKLSYELGENNAPSLDSVTISITNDRGKDANNPNPNPTPLLKGKHVPFAFLTTVNIYQQSYDIDPKTGDEVITSSIIIFSFEILIMPDMYVSRVYDTDDEVLYYNAEDYIVAVYPGEDNYEVVEPLAGPTVFNMFNYGAEQSNVEDRTRFVLRDFESSGKDGLISYSTRNKLEITKGGHIAKVTDTEINETITISDVVFVDTIVEVTLTFYEPIETHSVTYTFLVKAKYLLQQKAEMNKIYAQHAPVELDSMFTITGAANPFVFSYEIDREFEEYVNLNISNEDAKTVQGKKYSNEKLIIVRVLYKLQSSTAAYVNTRFTLEFTVEYNISSETPIREAYQAYDDRETPKDVESHSEILLSDIFAFKEEDGVRPITSITYEVEDMSSKDNPRAYIRSQSNQSGEIIKWIYFDENHLAERIIKLSAKPTDYELYDPISVYFRIIPGQTIELTYPMGEADKNAVLKEDSENPGTYLPDPDFFYYEQLAPGDEIDLFGTIEIKTSSGLDIGLNNLTELKITDTSEDYINGDIFNIGKVRVVAENTYTEVVQGVPTTTTENIKDKLSFRVLASQDGKNWVPATTSQMVVSTGGKVYVSPELSLTTWFKINITTAGGIDVDYLIKATVPKEDLQKNGGEYEIIFNYEMSVPIGTTGQADAIAYDEIEETRVIPLTDSSMKRVSVFDSNNYDYEDKFNFKFTVRDENDDIANPTICTLKSTSIDYVKNIVEGVAVYDSFVQTSVYTINSIDYTITLDNEGRLVIPKGLPAGTIIEVIVYNKYFVYENKYLLRVGEDIRITKDYGNDGAFEVSGTDSAFEMTYGVDGKFIVTDLQGNDITGKEKITYNSKEYPRVEISIYSPTAPDGWDATKEYPHLGNNLNEGNSILSLNSEEGGDGVVVIYPRAAGAEGAMILPSNNVSNPEGQIVKLKIYAAYVVVNKATTEGESDTYTLVQQEFVYAIRVMPSTEINFFNDEAKTEVNSINNPYIVYKDSTTDISFANLYSTVNLSNGLRVEKPDDVAEIVFSSEDNSLVTVDSENKTLKVIGDVIEDKIVKIKARTWYGYYAYFYVEIKPSYIIEVKGGDPDEVYDLYSYQKYNPLVELTDSEDGTRYVAVSRYDLATKAYVQLPVDEVKQLITSGVLEFDIEYIFLNGTEPENAVTTEPSRAFMSYYYDLVEVEAIASITENDTTLPTMKYSDKYKMYYHEYDSKMIYFNKEIGKYYEIVPAEKTYDVTIDTFVGDRWVTAKATLAVAGVEGEVEVNYKLHMQQNIKDLSIYNDVTTQAANSSTDRFELESDSSSNMENYVIVNLLRDYNISYYYSKSVAYSVETRITDTAKIEAAKENEVVEVDGDDYWIYEEVVEGDGSEEIVTTYKIYLKTETAGTSDEYYYVLDDYLFNNRHEILYGLAFSKDSVTNSSRLSVDEVYNAETGLFETHFIVDDTKKDVKEEHNAIISDPNNNILTTNNIVYIIVNPSHEHVAASTFSQAYSGQNLDLNILGDSFVANDGSNLVDGNLAYYLVDNGDNLKDLDNVDVSRFERIPNGILSTHNLQQADEIVERMVLVVFEKEIEGNIKKFIGVTTIRILPKYTIEAKYPSGLNYELLPKSENANLNSRNWEDYVKIKRHGEDIELQTITTLENYKKDSLKLYPPHDLTTTEDEQIVPLTFTVTEYVEEDVVNTDVISLLLPENRITSGKDDYWDLDGEKIYINEQMEDQGYIRYYRIIELTCVAQVDYKIVYSEETNLNYTYVSKVTEGVENYYNGDKIVLEDIVGDFYAGDVKLNGTYSFTLLNATELAEKGISINTAQGNSQLETRSSLEERVVSVLVEFSYFEDFNVKKLYAVMDIKLNTSVSFGLNYDNIEQKVTTIQVGETLDLATTTTVSYNNLISNTGKLTFDYEFYVYNEDGFFFSAYYNTADEKLVGVVKNEDGTFGRIPKNPGDVGGIENSEEFYANYFDYDKDKGLFTPKLSLQMYSVIIKIVANYRFETYDPTKSSDMYFHLSVQGVEYTFTPASNVVNFTYAGEGEEKTYLTKYDLYKFGQFSVETGVTDFKVEYKSNDTMYDFDTTYVWYKNRVEKAIPLSAEELARVKEDPTSEEIAAGCLYEDCVKAGDTDYKLTKAYYVSKIVTVEDMASQVSIIYETGGNKFYALVDVVLISPIEIRSTAATYQHGTEDLKQKLKVTRNDAEYEYTTMIIDLMSYITFKNIHLIGFEDITINMATSIYNTDGVLVDDLTTSFRKPVDVDHDFNEEIKDVDNAKYDFYEDAKEADENKKEAYLIKLFYENAMKCYFAPFGTDSAINNTLNKMKDEYHLDVAISFNIESTRQTVVVTYRMDFIAGFTDSASTFEFNTSAATALPSLKEKINNGEIRVENGVFYINSGTEITADELESIAFVSVGGQSGKHETTQSIVFTSGVNCTVVNDGTAFKTATALEEAEGSVYFNFKFTSTSADISSNFAFIVNPVVALNEEENAFANASVKEVTIEVEEGKVLNLATGLIGKENKPILLSSENNALGFVNIDKNGGSKLALSVVTKLYDVEENEVTTNKDRYFNLVTNGSLSGGTYTLEMLPGSEGSMLILYFTFSYSGTDTSVRVDPLYYTLVVKSKKCFSYSSTTSEISQKTNYGDISGYAGKFIIGDREIDASLYNPEITLLNCEGEYDLMYFNVIYSTSNGYVLTGPTRPYNIKLNLRHTIKVNGVAYNAQFSLVLKTTFSVVAKKGSAFIGVNYNFSDLNIPEPTSQFAVVYVGSKDTSTLDGSEGYVYDINNKLLKFIDTRFVLKHQEVYIVLDGMSKAYYVDLFVQYDSVEISFEINNNLENSNMLVIDDSYYTANYATEYQKAHIDGDGNYSSPSYVANGTGNFDSASTKGPFILYYSYNKATNNIFEHPEVWIDDPNYINKTTQNISGSNFIIHATHTSRRSEPVEISWSQDKVGNNYWSINIAESTTNYIDIIGQEIYELKRELTGETETEGDILDEDRHTIYETRTSYELVGYRYMVFPKQKVIGTVYDVLTIDVVYSGVTYKLKVPVEVRGNVYIPESNKSDPYKVELVTNEEYDLSVPGLTVADYSIYNGDFNKSTNKIKFTKTGIYTEMVAYEFNGKLLNNITYYEFTVRKGEGDTYTAKDVTIEIDLDNNRSVGFEIDSDEMTIMPVGNPDVEELSDFYNQPADLLSQASAIQITLGRGVVYLKDNNFKLISSQSGLYKINTSNSKQFITFYCHRTDTRKDFVYVQVTSTLGDIYCFKVNITVKPMEKLLENKEVGNGNTVSTNLLKNSTQSGNIKYVENTFEMTYIYVKRGKASLIDVVYDVTWKDVNNTTAYGGFSYDKDTKTYSAHITGEDSDVTKGAYPKFDFINFKFECQVRENTGSSCDALNIYYTVGVRFKDGNTDETITYTLQIRTSNQGARSEGCSISPAEKAENTMTPLYKTYTYAQTQATFPDNATTLVQKGNIKNLIGITNSSAKYYLNGITLLINSRSNVLIEEQEDQFIITVKDNNTLYILEFYNRLINTNQLGVVNHGYELKKSNGTSVTTIDIAVSDAINDGVFDISNYKITKGGTDVNDLLTADSTKLRVVTSSCPEVIVANTANDKIIVNTNGGETVLNHLIYDLSGCVLIECYVDNQAITFSVPVIIRANKNISKFYAKDGNTSYSSFGDVKNAILSEYGHMTSDNATSGLRITVEPTANSTNNMINSGNVVVSLKKGGTTYQSITLHFNFCTNNSDNFTIIYGEQDLFDPTSAISLNVGDRIYTKDFKLKDSKNQVVDVAAKLAFLDTREEYTKGEFSKLFEYDSTNKCYVLKQFIGSYRGYLSVKFERLGNTYVASIIVNANGRNLQNEGFVSAKKEYKYLLENLLKPNNCNISKVLSGDETELEINSTPFSVEVIQTSSIKDDFDIYVTAIKDGSTGSPQLITAPSYSYSGSLEDIGKTITLEVKITDKVFGASYIYFVDIVVSIDNLLLFQSAKEITPSSKDAKYSLDSLILVFYLSKEIDFDLNKELLLINKVLEVDNQLVYDKAIADGKTPEEAEAMKQKIKDNSVLGSYLTSFTDAIEKIKESGGGEIKFQASEQIYLNEYLLPFAKYYSDPEYKQEIKELTPEQSLSNTIQRIYVKFDLKTADDVFYTYHSYFDITIKSVINVSSGSYRMKPGSEINLFDSAYVDSIASVSFTSVIDTQDTAEEKTDYKDDTSLFIITPTTLSLALVDSKKAEEMIDKVFKIDILIQDKLGNSLTLTLYVTIAKNVETYTYIKQETPYYITSGTTASLLNNKIGILSYRGSDCVEVAKSSNPYGTFTFESESDMVVIYGSDILASDVLYDTSVLIKATYNDKTDNTMYSFYFNVVIKNEYSFISNDMVTLSSGAKGTYRVVNDGDVVDLTKIITVMKGEDEINNLNVTYSSDNAELEGCFDTENSTLTIPKGSVGKFFTINCMYTNGVQYKFVSYIIKVADLTYSFEMKDDTSVYIVQSGQTLNLDTVKGVFKDNNGNQITGEYKFLQYYHKQDENDDSEVGVCYYSIYTSADDGMQKLIARPVYSDITTFVIVQLTSAKNEVYLGTFKINILSTYKIVTENVTASVDGGVNTRVSSAADALDKKINYFDFGNNFVLNDTYRNVDYSDEKITILRNKNPNVDPADIERTFTFIYDEVDVSAALVDVGSGKKSYIVDGAEHFTIENNIVTFSAYASGHKLGIVATYFAIYDYDEDETYIGGSISSRIDITIVQNRFISLMKSDIEAAKLINGDYDVVVKYDYEFININREFTTPSYTEDGDGVATYTFQNVNESGETVTMFTLSEGALSFTENARPYKLQIVGGGETKEIIINEFMERGYILSQDVSNSNAAVLAAYTYKFVSAIPTASLLSDGVTTSYSCGAREMFTVKDNKLKFTNQSSYAAGAYRLQITSSYIFEGLDDRTYSSVQIVEPENQTSSILLDANNTMDVFNNQMKTGFDLRYLFRLVDKEGYMIEMNRDDFLIYVNNNLIASDSENFSSSDSFILKLGAGSGRKVVKIVDKYLQNYVQYSGWIG